MRSTLRLALLVPLLAAWPGAASAQSGPVIGGGGLWPLWSPPGWFGPGPGWGRWNDPGPGYGWQYYGVPNGPTVVPPPGRYAGVGVGYAASPYLFGPPAATRSFWSNGLSLYGPPVPTYAPIPGVFGAGDANKTFFRNPPPSSAVWFGLGWFGPRSPSPRFGPVNVSVWPAAPPPSVELVRGAPAATADGAPCIRLAVRVPAADADLWVEKTETKDRGAERLFESPPLEAGKTYRYELIARWKENGQERAESRTVTAAAGQTVRVDFTRPADEPPASGGRQPPDATPSQPRSVASGG